MQAIDTQAPLRGLDVVRYRGGRIILKRDGRAIGTVVMRGKRVVIARDSADEVRQRVDEIRECLEEEKAHVAEGR